MAGGPFDSVAHHCGDEPAGHHHQHAGGAGRRAACFPRGLLEFRSEPLANDSHNRPAQFAQRHFDRHYLVVSRAAGETAPILFTGATTFKFIADSGLEKVFPYSLKEPFMAMSTHLHIILTQISQMPVGMQYGCAAVLIMLILFINSFAIALRVWLRGRKRW